MLYNICLPVFKSHLWICIVMWPCDLAKASQMFITVKREDIIPARFEQHAVWFWIIAVIRNAVFCPFNDTLTSKAANAFVRLHLDMVANATRRLRYCSQHTKLGYGCTTLFVGRIWIIPQRNPVAWHSFCVPSRCYDAKDCFWWQLIQVWKYKWHLHILLAQLADNSPLEKTVLSLLRREKSRTSC